MNTTNIFDHNFCKDAEFNEAMNDFLDMRKKIKKPATERAVRSLIKTVIEKSGGNLELAIKIIDQSITYCYLDFYPLKEDSRGMPQQNRKREEL